jgi:DnaK suppressor protein
MNPQNLAEYEARLRALLAELEEQLATSRDERSPVEVDGRMGRVSRADAMQVQQMAVEMARRREERLLRVRTALDRIRNGAYGRCGRCAGPIDPARLDAMPEVVLCVHCASTPKP